MGESRGHTGARSAESGEGGGEGAPARSRGEERGKRGRRSAGVAPRSFRGLVEPQPLGFVWGCGAWARLMVGKRGLARLDPRLAETGGGGLDVYEVSRRLCAWAESRERGALPPCRGPRACPSRLRPSLFLPNIIYHQSHNHLGLFFDKEGKELTPSPFPCHPDETRGWGCRRSIGTPGCPRTPRSRLSRIHVASGRGMRLSHLHQEVLGSQGHQQEGAPSPGTLGPAACPFHVPLGGERIPEEATGRFRLPRRRPSRSPAAGRPASCPSSRRSPPERDPPGRGSRRPVGREPRSRGRRRRIDGNPISNGPSVQRVGCRDQGLTWRNGPGAPSENKGFFVP